MMNSVDPMNLAGHGLVVNSTFHHLGFVVASIADVAKDFAESLGAEWDGVVIHEPLQSVRVTFLRPPAPRNPVLELIEPAADPSPVSRFLKRGGGLHHLCYEVDGLDHRLEAARSAGMLIARPPYPAVSFAGRRIAWVYTRQRLLVELLEK